MLFRLHGYVPHCNVTLRRADDPSSVLYIARKVSPSLHVVNATPATAWSVMYRWYSGGVAESLDVLGERCDHLPPTSLGRIVPPHTSIIEDAFDSCLLPPRYMVDLGGAGVGSFALSVIEASLVAHNASALYVLWHHSNAFRFRDPRIHVVNESYLFLPKLPVTVSRGSLLLSDVLQMKDPDTTTKRYCDVAHTLLVRSSNDAQYDVGFHMQHSRIQSLKSRGAKRSKTFTYMTNADFDAETRLNKLFEDSLSSTASVYLSSVSQPVRESYTRWINTYFWNVSIASSNNRFRNFMGLVRSNTVIERDSFTMYSAAAALIGSRSFRMILPKLTVMRTRPELFGACESISPTCV